ncbi:MAG: hypothetical protein KDA49_12725, partial [Rhodospirillaceae bacterium]|nr:hypothetical protein [Rhodospirillaceae bacterium]
MSGVPPELARAAVQFAGRRPVVGEDTRHSAEVLSLPKETIQRVATAERPVAISGTTGAVARDGSQVLQTASGEALVRLQPPVPPGSRVALQVPPQPGLTEAKLAREPVRAAAVKSGAAVPVDLGAKPPAGLARGDAVTLSADARAALPPVPAPGSAAGRPVTATDPRLAPQAPPTPPSTAGEPRPAPSPPPA